MVGIDGHPFSNNGMIVLSTELELYFISVHFSQKTFWPATLEYPEFFNSVNFARTSKCSRFASVCLAKENRKQWLFSPRLGEILRVASILNKGWWAV